ncbi:MAG: ferritin [Verrucomicrobiales bacterium]|nr:ferritin [Verrucomicrobiales bacterium]
MVLSDKLNAAINEQIGHEFAASLQYVAIASYLEREGLPGLARHFFKQAEEERDHAMRFVRYLNELEAPLALPAVVAPQGQFASPEAAVALALTREQTVTRQINHLMDLAVQDQDHLSRQFLGWFVREQLEEEASVGHLLKMMQRAGDKNLFLVEAYLLKQADSDSDDAD